MEDNIGTIFYIVLTVIVLIITALNRKRRQKTAAPPALPKKETDAFDPFQAFEQDSMEPGVEGSDQTTTTSPEAASAQSQLESYLDERDSIFRDRPSQEESIDIQFKEEMLTDDKEHQPPEDLSKIYEVRQIESELDKIMKEFDLKKAIIHSEIINRKEF